MAVVPIQKVRILALRSKIEELVADLQRKGVIELREVIDCEQCMHELHEGDESQFAYTQAEVEFALRFLAPHDDRKMSLSEKAKTGGKLILTDEEIKKTLEKEDVTNIIAGVEKLEVKQQKIKTRREQIKQDVEQFTPWKDLPGNVADYKATNAVVSLMGVVKPGADEKAAQLNARDDAALTRLTEEGAEQEAWQLFIQKDKEGEEEIQDILSEVGFEQVQLPEEAKTVKQLLKEREQEIKDLDKQEKDVDKRVKKQTKHIDTLKIAYDHATWRTEEFEAIDTAAATEKVAVLEGFIRERDFDNFKKKLEKEHTPIVVEKMDLAKGEEPPVTIENNALFAPFEAVTRIYGLPKNGELDPTPYLSPFFAVYFALCLTDAAYGMILFVLCFLAQRFVHMGAEAKKLVRLIMIGGLFTSVIGVLFGGWFGITQENLPMALRDVTLIDPLQDVMIFLGLAAALGFVQLIVGLIINVVWKLKNKDKSSDVWAGLSWIILLLTVAAHVGLPYIGTDLSAMTMPLIYVLAVSVAFFSGKDLLAKKKKKMSKGAYVGLSILLAPVRALSGILGLYGIIGYVSDILSYSRLLALGLSTGIVALAINIIAALVRDMIPGVGWVFMILILVGGHTFNIVNNVLGAYIHSGRLQFVEFFPKFLEGGGEEWKPLVRKGEYVEVKKA